MKTHDAIRRAIERMDPKTHAALATAVGVTPAAVSHWLTGKRKVAPKHVRTIERVTNGAVTRYQLRPDVFGKAA